MSLLQVDVWAWSLDEAPEERARLARFLNGEERTRAARFALRELSERWTVARGRLREVLGARLNMAPADLRFGRDARGKPFLEGGTSLAFNLSHTGDIAALAVAAHGDLGIDIELVRPLREPVAERFFSVAENQVLNAHAEDHREAAFYRCWTRKEAFIKAMGTGLSTPLESFDVAFALGEPPRLLRVEGAPEEPANWVFWHFAPRPDCMGAAAVRAREAHFRFNCDGIVFNDRIAVPQ